LRPQAEDLDAGAELLGITPSPFVVLSLKSKTENAVQSQVSAHRCAVLSCIGFPMEEHHRVGPCVDAKGGSCGCGGVAQVLSSTVNPVWNEHFDLLSYREADELTLTGTPFTRGLLDPSPPCVPLLYATLGL